MFASAMVLIGQGKDQEGKLRLHSVLKYAHHYLGSHQLVSQVCTHLYVDCCYSICKVWQPSFNKGIVTNSACCTIACQLACACYMMMTRLAS